LYYTLAHGHGQTGTGRQRQMRVAVTDLPTAVSDRFYRRLNLHHLTASGSHLSMQGHQQVGDVRERVVEVPGRPPGGLLLTFDTSTPIFYRHSVGERTAWRKAICCREPSTS
jgi:hypothetical protein